MIAALTATGHEAGRFLRKRPALCASALALALLAAVAAASCSATRVLHFIAANDAPPGSVPALSLAGRAASGCINPKPSHLVHAGFEVAEPSYFDSDGNVPTGAYAREGVGHAVLHYFACTRYSVEITVVVSNRIPLDPSRQMEVWRAADLLESLIPRPSGRITLWTVANVLRISRREPFVYGTERKISEDESVSLRFDPTQNDARLMFVYRLGL